MLLESGLICIGYSTSSSPRTESFEISVSPNISTFGLGVEVGGRRVAVRGGGAGVGDGPQPGSITPTILKTTTRNKTFFNTLVSSFILSITLVTFPLKDW
jgi:hypothetical protein